MSLMNDLFCALLMECYRLGILCLQRDVCEGADRIQYQGCAARTGAKPAILFIVFHRGSSIRLRHNSVWLREGSRYRARARLSYNRQPSKEALGTVLKLWLQSRSKVRPTRDAG